MKKEREKKSRLAPQADVIEFVPAKETAADSSALIPADGRETKEASVEILSPSATLEDMPPVFRELAMPKLPELSKENRGRLLMQTPNRLFFYWSVGSNPFHKLNKALGSHTSSYTLVLKLVDLKRDSEQIHPVDTEGTWWFDVEADGQYRAEIGFYAPNRPYVRALFSNTVETPRKSPSSRVDTESDWAVSATRFARVLEVAGFTQDAFDVAIAGDDREKAEVATRGAFSAFVERDDLDLDNIAADELRYALLLIASGASLEALKWTISPALYALLQQQTSELSSEKALRVLQDRFEIEADEITEEVAGPAVFGASAINFPRQLKTKRALPKFSPISSGRPAN